MHERNPDTRIPHGLRVGNGGGFSIEPYEGGTPLHAYFVPPLS